MTLVFLGLGLLVASGVAAAALSRAPRLAGWCGVLGVVSGCAVIGVPAARGLVTAQSTAWSGSWDAVHGALRVEIDPLSAFFLAPVLVLSGLAAVYGGPYMASHPRRKKLGGHWFFFNLFVAGMVAVLVARTVVLFMAAWEVMSISAFALVTFEHERASVQRAGWTYLIAAHVGAACILAALLLLGNQAGALDFDLLRQRPSPSAGFAGLVFVLALIGFGAKAGFVPVHVWLPEAHPAAPSHVSALMSGVMVKMGIYGLLRTATFLGAPQPWWGVCLAIVGLATAVFGIALALGQRDVKRVLAYSTIENMGLVALSLGIGLWGLAVGQTAISVLGFSAALLHVWNHAAMKGLMFLAAGSLVHATGTKDLERLGGLMKRMPWTGGTLMLGAVAVAALPPLNGFVAKWLLYLVMVQVGLTSSDVLGAAALVGTGVVAAVGGLAAVTFVRLAGVALLGQPRGESAGHAHECPWGMRAAMLLLGGLCVGAGIVPQWVIPYPRAAVREIAGPTPDDAVAWTSVTDLLSTMGIMNGVVWTSLIVGSGALVALLRHQGTTSAATWGCGYLGPTPRMQYTGASFSELTATRLLPRLLGPRIVKRPPGELFPAGGSFASSCPDPVTRGVYEPFFARWAGRFAALRVLQQGKMQIYLVYILVVVVVGMSWVAVRSWLSTS